MAYPNPHGSMCPWFNITEKTGAPNIKWCEETLCDWISEPANTWSNLGYMLVAIIILNIGIKHKHNSNLKQFGPIIFFMGAMSFFYHQSNFYGSQILDFVGMFFFVGWAIGQNLIRLGHLKYNQLKWFNLSLALIYLVAMHAMYISEIKFQAIVLISGFIILATELMARKVAPVKYGWFATTIGSLIVAFGFSLSDGQRVWCNPASHGWFSQGHAVWHWVAAIGMFTIYKHYTQEALKPQEQT
jgi:hypothetical protein